MENGQDLVAFIRGHVRSVWALELLLLLRSNPAARWSSAALVRELRASTKLVQENLAGFERDGLAAQDAEGWRFAPATSLLEELTGRLAALYRERPMATIALISRIDPVQSLADAFKLKGDDK